MPYLQNYIRLSLISTDMHVPVSPLNNSDFKIRTEISQSAQ